MFHKDYDHKGSVVKIRDSSHEPQEAQFQDKPMGGKVPVVK
jgi:hypothetical protein